jgi:hypothetical protein
LEVSTTQKKFKWAKPNDPTKFGLYYPPPHSVYELPKGKKTEAWDNWTRSMMMDTRFSGTERSILIAIALHYNLKTGACFPMHGRVAVEAGLDPNPTGMNAVQRAVSKAVSLGWLSRVFYRGGPGEKNQANHYELMVPQSIWDALANVAPRLVIAEMDGGWQVTQATDGVAICGPFKDRANAEKWIEEHGPTGQKPPTDRTKVGGRPDISPPHNKESNREEEHSVYSIQPAPVADAPVAKGKEESERVPVAPIHRKSTSFKEAILRVESIIAPEVPREK